MQTFSDYLKEKGVSEQLAGILTDLTDVFVDIDAGFSKSGKEKLEGYVGSKNVTGDDQIAMDVFANDLFVEKMRNNSSMGLIVSEEEEDAIHIERAGDSEVFSVVSDPLDGSSIAEVNLAVGTIVGVYSGNEILGRKGREQVASIIAVYGPGLTFLVTVGHGTDEFIYNPSIKEFVLQHKQLKMSSEGKIFAPGNVKIIKTDSWYFKLIEDMAKDGYALRYSGGMVPDVNQIIRKGGGIFMYPGSKDKPEGKLRLLYECAPIAFLMEQAGGKAVYGEGDILDIEIKEYHQRTPIFVGSSKEVDLAVSYANKV